jgi:hypothetical protein
MTSFYAYPINFLCVLNQFTCVITDDNEADSGQVEFTWTRIQKSNSKPKIDWMSIQVITHPRHQTRWLSKTWNPPLYSNTIKVIRNFCQQMYDIDYIFTCINKRQQTTQNFKSQLRTNLIAYRNNLLIKSNEFLFKIIYFGSPLGICG